MYFAADVDVERAYDKVCKGDVQFCDQWKHGYRVPCTIVGCLEVNNQPWEFWIDRDRGCILDGQGRAEAH